MSWTPWSGAFGDDEEDEEDLGYQGGSTWGNKDSLILLIDCTAPMFENHGADEMPFDLCIQCAVATMKNKIISSDKDLMAVIFFGTDKQKNPSDFKNVYIFQDLDMPDAERILELQQLREDDGFSSFKDEYGHSTGFSLSDVLWTCSNMFSTSSQKIGHKRIMLFTNTDSPHCGNGALESQAKTKAKDVAGLGISIELMHIQGPTRKFDITKFYQDILMTDEDEDLGVLPDPSEKFEELLTRVRQKDHKKRTMASIPLKLADGIELGVSVFNLCLSARKSSYVTLYSKSNEEVKTRTQYVCEDTGQALLPQDIKYSQTFGGEKAIFEKEEVDGMKKFGDAGLLLMGFKPRSLLKQHVHIKHANFIYPDEKSITGSTRLFSALLSRCSAKEVVAICRYRPRNNAPPRFVALVPQEEEKDESNVQLQPPGFHVIFLPFAEDFRKLKYDQTFPKANAEQIQKAKEIINKLKFRYQAGQIENPALQKHYRTLEALALDLDVPEEFEDMTEPDVIGINKKVRGLVEEFKELVFPEGYNPAAKSAPKRKVAEGGAGAKKPKVEVNVNMEEEARKGMLTKQTVPVLKEFAKSIGLKCGTKKADIIEAINIHFGI